MTWDKSQIDRGTKCFSPMNNGYPGGYPVGYLEWVRSKGWWGDKRLHVPCGQVDDLDSVRIDVKEEGTNATHVFDARDLTNWEVLGNMRFNCIMIDPPYTKELAAKLYDTEKYYSGVNSFIKPAVEYLEEGGYLITLTYEVPKRPKGCNLIAHWGLYQAVAVSHTRCSTVWQKEGKRKPQGLGRWTDENA